MCKYTAGCPCIAKYPEEAKSSATCKLLLGDFQEFFSK